MKRASSIFLFAVGLGTAVLGVAQAPGEPAQGPRPREVPQDTREEEKRRATTYARVGESTVTVGDLEEAIASQDIARPHPTADPARLRALAEERIELELLSAEGARRGYGQRAEVQRRYEEALLERFIRQEFDEPYRSRAVSDADVAAYYEANEGEFVIPEQVRASHILVASEREARAIIEEVRSMDLRARRQLARDRSLDAETKRSGGDLGVFGRSGLPAGGSGSPVHHAIVEAAFSLNERGDVHPRPVPVGGRFSVVMLTMKSSAATRSLEAAAPTIRLRINERRRREAIDALLSALRARTRPEKHPERLAPITFEARAEPAGLPEPRAKRDRTGAGAS